MATSNKYESTTIKVLEDLSSGCQYHAICLDDCELANNGEEAAGILINKPNTNAHGEIAWRGEISFAAGEAISKGDKLTVTTSGWFTAAASLDPTVGEAKAAVTSGSIGVGLFSGFSVSRHPADYVDLSVTAKCDYIAGAAIAFDDLLVADDGEEADGVALSSISSGSAGKVGVMGKMSLKMDPAECSSLGDVLTVTTSGYFSIGDSGDYISAKALTNIGSNSVGTGLFFGQGYYLSI